MNKEYALLPYQAAWTADTSPIKIYEKSRRIGVTYAEAADDVLLASGNDNDGMDIWYIGYNKEMALEFINDCAYWVKKLSRAAKDIEEIFVKDKDKDILAFRIRFASGYRITALSSKPSNIRGKQGKVVIDEAAFHDNLPKLLKAATALLMWGGRVVIISTHNGDDNPFNGLVNETRAGKKKYSLHRTDLDEAISQGLYKKICHETKKEWSKEKESEWRNEVVDSYGSDADEELFVIPSSGQGSFLSRSLIMSCMDESIPVLQWECKDGFSEEPEQDREDAAKDWCEENLKEILDNLDRNTRSYVGEDFGRSGDLTVLIPLQEQKNLSYKAPFILELRNVPFDQQRQVVFYVIDRLPRFTLGAFDKRGNGEYLAEVAMQRYTKNKIHEIALSQEWYRQNMPKYKAAFEEKTILLPKDSDILADHRALKMEKGVAKVPERARSTGSDGKQRHGDSAIAGALAVYATNQEIIENDVTGVELISMESTNIWQ